MGTLMGILKYPVRMEEASQQKKLAEGMWVVCTKRCAKIRRFYGKKQITKVLRPSSTIHVYFLDNEKIGYKSIELELY